MYVHVVFCTESALCNSVDFGVGLSWIGSSDGRMAGRIVVYLAFKLDHLTTDENCIKWPCTFFVPFWLRPVLVCVTLHGTDARPTACNCWCNLKHQRDICFLPVLRYHLWSKKLLKKWKVYGRFSVMVFVWIACILFKICWVFFPNILYFSHCCVIPQLLC